jgi:uncharacterized membrane protein YsdA (DUF1294 family)
MMNTVLYYSVANLICFALFAWDKWAARTQQYRIAEFNLHLSCLLDGAAGALIAQQLLRHKTKKFLFTLIIYLSIALHSLLIIAISNEPSLLHYALS